MILSLPFFLFCTLFCADSCADSTASKTASPLQPDWSENAKIEPSGRPNPYGWDEATLQKKIRKGQSHALHYPIEITGILIPARIASKILDLKEGDPLFGIFKALLSLDRDYQDFSGFWKWLGLTDYPQTDAEIPFPKEGRPNTPMGVGLIHRKNADGITLSCAACHAGSLFGKPILGISNRFPRSNLFFLKGDETLKKMNPKEFQILTGSSPAETEIYSDAREHSASTSGKRPQTLGLDTSLAQIALSLAKRAPSAQAERTAENARHPRPNLLDHWVADSKPAVWWNIKYKTHWLSDGSVRSGNPILTNFLWNEIGRGTDLPDLEKWLQKSNETIEELTTAVFATQAPKWKDFFGENSIRIDRAKRGEQIYLQNCASCHGQYQKNWPNFNTVKVQYIETIKDVGTDDHRRIGMRGLEEGLNFLALSKNFNIVVREQKGYIPPPLEGIWARYPYLHNNSVPSLCALMTEPARRPKVYYSGPADRLDRDYDSECVGYPTGDSAPKEWKKNPDYQFDTKKTGLSNSGHYDGIFSDLTADQKSELIEFLKTL